MLSAASARRCRFTIWTLPLRIVLASDSLITRLVAVKVRMYPIVLVCVSHGEDRVARRAARSRRARHAGRAHPALRVPEPGALEPDGLRRPRRPELVGLARKFNTCRRKVHLDFCNAGRRERPHASRSRRANGSGLAHACDSDDSAACPGAVTCVPPLVRRHAGRAGVVRRGGVPCPRSVPEVAAYPRRPGVRDGDRYCPGRSRFPRSSPIPSRCCCGESSGCRVPS